MSAPVRAVVFDLGGVMIRICRSWGEACARAGIEPRHDERTWEDGLHRRHTVRDAYERGEIDGAEFCRRLSVATGGVYHPSEVERLHRAWLLEPYPGVEALVHELHDRTGVRTACLSNTNQMHWRAMTGEDDGAPALPALVRLGRRLASHQLGLAKPHAGIYRLAERALGCAPGEILFFDDLAANVEAALALGWRAERIDHEGDPASQMRRALARAGLL